eukprot:48940-Hanusia_phi.AAC.1
MDGEEEDEGCEQVAGDSWASSIARPLIFDPTVDPAVAKMNGLTAVFFVSFIVIVGWTLLQVPRTRVRSLTSFLLLGRVLLVLPCRTCRVLVKVTPSLLTFRSSCSGCCRCPAGQLHRCCRSGEGKTSPAEG